MAFEPSAIRRWQRELNAMIEAAGDDDPEGFAVVVRLLDQAHGEGLKEAAAKLREVRPNGIQGYSWQEIARPLGITRQGAFQRFRRS